MRAVLSLGLAGFVTGCHCKPEIPNPPDDEDTTPTGTTGATGDTAPPPPCEVPEVEPNDALETTTPLPLERQACGLFLGAEGGADLDWWSFTLEEDHWLEVDLRAANGSIADVAMLLQPADGEWSVLREDDLETNDASVRFEAPAGEYVLTANEQTFSAGERFGYVLVVSEAKQPFDLYTMVEAEPNGDTVQANVIGPDEIVYGRIDGGPSPLPDQDWFRIDIPADKHTLAIDVDAYRLGSTADLTARFYDGGGGVISPPGAMTGGGGGDPDPIGDYESPGGESVYIQLLDTTNREGAASWYVLKVTLVE